MRLSVVVGTLNRRARLQACLESIVQETRVPVRVWVADAGSTDGTVEYLRALASDRLVPVFAGRPLGQARAYNEVFARLDTPYACWLSDDNVVVNGGLDVAVGILEAEARIGMIGLKTRDVTGPFTEAPYVGGISSIGILNVNQGVLRLPILRALGGFSEEFRDYGIDPDLTTRVLLAGHAVAYTREIALLHHRSWSTDRTSSAWARQMERHEASLQLYARIYAPLARPGVAWRLKRLGWPLLRRTFAVSINSPRRVAGLLPRDWYNMLCARSVSVFDPWRCRGRAFHLLQTWPTRRRRAGAVAPVAVGSGRAGSPSPTDA